MSKQSKQNKAQDAGSAEFYDASGLTLPSSKTFRCSTVLHTLLPSVALGDKPRKITGTPYSSFFFPPKRDQLVTKGLLQSINLHLQYCTVLRIVTKGQSEGLNLYRSALETSHRGSQHESTVFAFAAPQNVTNRGPAVQYMALCLLHVLDYRSFTAGLVL